MDDFQHRIASDDGGAGFRKMWSRALALSALVSRRDCAFVRKSAPVAVRRFNEPQFPSAPLAHKPLGSASSFNFADLAYLRVKEGYGGVEPASEAVLLPDHCAFHSESGQNTQPGILTEPQAF